MATKPESTASTSTNQAAWSAKRPVGSPSIHANPSLEWRTMGPNTPTIKPRLLEYEAFSP